MTPIQLAEKIMEVLGDAKSHTRTTALEIAKELSAYQDRVAFWADQEAYKQEQEAIAQGIK